MNAFHKLLLPMLLIGLLLNTSLAGNRELMKQQKLKVLQLNEAVIKQIHDLSDDAMVSFVGRVVKNKDGSIEILVDKIDKTLSKNNFTIRPSGHYIQYMSFEEMQKLPVPSKQISTPTFYGGGTTAQPK